MIRWFAVNGIAANFLMMAILVAGAYTAFYGVPLEVSPALSWDEIRIEMLYRGATAKDVERMILIPIEESLQGVRGIKQINSEGNRGRARVKILAEPSTNLRVLVEEVKARVDTITTFPTETERPRIFIPDSADRYEVLSVAVTGNLDAHGLRKVTRRVMDDLLEMPSISQAVIKGERRYEISIEANAGKLLSYGLSFQDLADAVRRFSIDMPAGAIDSESGTFIVRTRGQAYSEREFGEIPIRAANGAQVLLGDVAEIHDGFEEGDKVVEFNGKPALFVELLRTGNESAIDISNKAREYVRTASTRFPEGIDLYVYDDDSLSIRGRLSTLVWSLLQGSLLVLLLLGLFLRPALAFWIVVGIPVGFAGGMLMMPWFGVTANVMSLFGYIIVVGIVVDDAIVTGENIYSKVKSGVPPLEAAVKGTHEVTTPVTFGALTTIVAFFPLLFFEGTWGDFAQQIPPIVAPVLLFSLVETKLILPAHLKHLRPTNDTNAFARFQTRLAGGLERFVERVYQPTLIWSVRHRAAVLAGFTAMGLAMAGYCVGGHMGFVSFPSVERLRISATLDLPDNTPLETTAKYMDRFKQALAVLKKEFVDPGTGESLIRNVTSTTGAGYHASRFDKSRCYLSIELMSPDERTVPGPKNSEIANRWMELVGPIPEATRYRIYGDTTLKKDTEYDDEFLNIELRGPSSPEKIAVAMQIKSMLESYDGITLAWAKMDYDQDELELSLKPRAAELGLNQASLARQIRQAFYGEEAQRVQRGVDDIRVMVRLPQDARESLYSLDQMKIRTPRGAYVPLETVAQVTFVTAPSEVERRDGAEIIRCGGQPADETVDILGIAEEITPRLTEMCQKENLSFQFQGHVAEAEAARKRTILGGVALFFALYAMLSVALKSLVQPFFVLLAVPFALIGALLGHILLDMTPSFLSVFGMLALAGVSVNDTLVMVDYVNRRRNEGASLREATLEAGGKRFRPIILTSVTTFAGLLPLMMDRSLQAQFLIPMAVSLAFGVLFATVITLYLIPCTLLMADDFRKALIWFCNWYSQPFSTDKPKHFETDQTVTRLPPSH